MVGRQAQRRLLDEAHASPDPELVVVSGRRRVGKTYLVRQHLADKVDLEVVGIRAGDRQTQIQNFAFAIQQAFDLDQPPSARGWLELFQHLVVLTTDRYPDGRFCFFLDEFPWMDSPRSGFLQAFEFFWNSYASRHDCLVIICGSATSWIYRKILTNTGGLHNRVSRHIHLSPFTLSETKLYLTSLDIRLTDQQVALLYMSIGGIPYYLKGVRCGESAIQAIDRLCFADRAPLRYEFDQLYAALFTRPDRYIEIVRKLNERRSGYTHQQLAQATSLSSGGTLRKTLIDLEQSGFIQSTAPWGNKKKETRYRLIDEFSLFYLRFMEDMTMATQRSWRQIAATPAFHSWTGYAWENISFRHIDMVQRALGISGIISTHSSYYQRLDGDDRGCQIDMLIDRADDVVSLCEMKYSRDTYTLTAKEAAAIDHRRAVIDSATSRRKQVFVVMITPLGIKPNVHTLGLVDQEVTLADFFDNPEAS